MVLLSRDPAHCVGWRVRCLEPEYLMGLIFQQGGTCWTEKLRSPSGVGGCCRVAGRGARFTPTGFLGGFWGRTGGFNSFKMSGALAFSDMMGP